MHVVIDCVFVCSSLGGRKVVKPSPLGIKDVGLPLLALEGLAGIPLLDSPSVGWTLCILDALLLRPFHFLGDVEWDLADAAARKSFKTSRRCRSRCWRTRTFVRTNRGNQRPSLRTFSEPDLVSAGAELCPHALG